jgi:signal transduction histidine kinase
MSRGPQPHAPSPPPGPPAERAAPDEPPTSGCFATSSLRILVVDDDRGARSTLSALLRGEGLATATAADGAAALEEVARSRPDVVLADVQMPGMSGLELCRRLSALDPDLPVIVVTAHSDEEVVVESLRAGAVDYMTKPLDFDAVLWRVWRAIEQRAAKLEQRQLYERTQALYQQALVTVRAYENALAAAAHDLRAPLGVVSMQAEALAGLAASSRERAELSGMAECLGRSVARMGQLITNVLDEARLRAGRLPLKLERHPLAALLADALELRPLAVPRGVRLEIAPPARDRPVVCDRGKIGQVLANLVSNAIKYSPPRGVIRIAAAGRDGGTCFAVSDDGQGIAPEACARVFERFWQSPEGGASGLGLGLFIAKSIVEAHGGTIWVESQLGAGSTFSFSLPDLSPG